MSKPIVLIAEELSPATIDALGPDFEIRQIDGSDRAQLLRPSPTSTPCSSARPPRWTPRPSRPPRTSRSSRAPEWASTTSTSPPRRRPASWSSTPRRPTSPAPPSSPSDSSSSTARNIAPANQALKAGAWKRSKYGGVELLDKKVGVVGFGRIGQLVAERLKGFGMEILAYDPYVSAQKAGQLGARLVSLDELLAESDFITVHLPKSPETLGLLGKEAFAKVKPSVRIINAARGGIVDEQALADALRDGLVAGAGIDVFATEPTTQSPLFEFESVVVTPHLGASTDEAQEKAGVAVAKSVRLALGGDLVPDAVNVAGGTVAEEVRPGIDLVEKLGRIFTGVAGSVPVQLDVDVRGEITEHDVSVWELAALKGVFTDVTEDAVTYVNAPLLAKERGCEVRLLTDAVSEEFRNVTILRGTLADGTTVSVAGTLTGPKMVQKLTGINGFDLEVAISDHMAFFSYKDRPGVVGVIGRLLGEADVNIGGMQVARDEAAAPPWWPSPWTTRSPAASWAPSLPRSRRTSASSTWWSDFTSEFGCGTGLLIHSTYAVQSPREVTARHTCRCRCQRTSADVLIVARQ